MFHLETEILIILQDTRIEISLILTGREEI